MVYASVMTEQQNPSPDHRAPLAPGEIRTHTVGTRTFQVMHVLNGAMAQASYRDAGQPSVVITTNQWISNVVGEYADAIEQAEAAEIVEETLADPNAVVTFMPSEAGQAGGYVPSERFAIYAHDDAAEAAEQRAEPDLTFNTPDGASMTLVTGEPQPAPSLADDVAALRLEIATMRGDEGANRRTAILARFDRIAAQVPVPTRVWMHRCGVVLINDTEPPPCHVCVSTPQIRFQRLYTIGEMR